MTEDDVQRMAHEMKHFYGTDFPHKEDVRKVFLYILADRDIARRHASIFRNNYNSCRNIDPASNKLPWENTNDDKA